VLNPNLAVNLQAGKKEPAPMPLAAAIMEKY
jgi:hypothetical protein